MIYMASYLLDTNHVSPIVTPGHRLRSLIIQRHDAGDTFSIAVPALTEMLFGIRLLPRAERNLRDWQRFEPLFGFYDITKQDAEYAANLQATLRKQGRQLGLVDALIAAIALRYDLILLTTDKDFQPVVGLTQQNWLAI